MVIFFQDRVMTTVSLPCAQASGPTESNSRASRPSVTAPSVAFLGWHADAKERPQRPGHDGLIMHRKPMWPVLVSTVSAWRAAGR